MRQTKLITCYRRLYLLLLLLSTVQTGPCRKLTSGTICASHSACTLHSIQTLNSAAATHRLASEAADKRRQEPPTATFLSTLAQVLTTRNSFFSFWVKFWARRYDSHFLGLAAGIGKSGLQYILLQVYTRPGMC